MSSTRVMQGLLAAAAIVLPLATAPAADTLRFGGGQQGSQNYGVNAALAQAIKAHTDIDVSLQAFGGPTAYIPLINSGELDMAAMVMPDVGDAVRGNGPFKGQAQENLRMVVALFPSPVGLMVRADSGIEAIADLAGKRVAWGMPAQASLQPYIVGALANGGLGEGDVRRVPVASVANGVQALIDGNVDATLFALRGGAVVKANAALGGIRWVPFDNSQAAVERMQVVAPEAYLVEMDADDKIVGISGAMHTMAYDYVLLARKELSDDIVGAIAALLRDKGTEIAAESSVLGAITSNAVARTYQAIPLHPAAAAVLESN